VGCGHIALVNGADQDQPEFGIDGTAARIHS
jgi:hypothetical protein